MLDGLGFLASQAIFWVLTFIIIVGFFPNE